MKSLCETLSKSMIKNNIISWRINDCYIVWPKGPSMYYDLKKQYKNFEHCIGKSGFLFFLLPKSIAIKLKAKDPEYIKLYELTKEYVDMEDFEKDCANKKINLSNYSNELKGLKEII